MEISDGAVLNGGGHHRIEVGTSAFEKRVGGLIRKHIQEAAMDFYGLLGSGFDPYDMMQDLQGDFAGVPSYVPPHYRQNVKRGEYIPVYLDWNQLRFLRDRSRKLIDNPYYQSAVTNRVNYAIGAKGITIQPVKARPDSPDEDLEMVGRVLDLWQARNDIPDITKTISLLGDQDGDLGIRDFVHESGVLDHRVVYAEHIKPPAGNDYPPHYSFGIQTDPDDIEQVEGFWVVDKPLTNTNPDFVPASEMSFFKYNTPKGVKRGMPLFWGGTDILLRAAFDLLRGVVTTANVRARYAVIRKLTKGVLKDAAEKLLKELNQLSVTDPGTGQTINVQRVPFGSIVTEGAGQELEFPHADLDSTAFETALQMVLRALAARCNMPEWMFTSDASNANYSSSMVAEAPSTKMFEERQEMICRRVAINKSPGKESLAWRQIKAAVNAGVLHPRVVKTVNLTAEGPILTARDKDKEAQTHKLYVDMGATSVQKVQQELGLDSEEVLAEKLAWAKQQAELQAVQGKLQAAVQAQMPQPPQQPGDTMQGPGMPQNGANGASGAQDGSNGPGAPPNAAGGPPVQGNGDTSHPRDHGKFTKKAGTPLHEAKFSFNREDCPKCKAKLEGDPSSGKCNSCGFAYGVPMKEAKPAQEPTADGGDDVRQRAEVIADILGGLFGKNALAMLDKTP